MLDTRGRSAGGHVRTLALTSMRRTALGRKVLYAAAGATTAAFVLAVAATAVAIHVAF
jgi:hypothetical protein